MMSDEDLGLWIRELKGHAGIFEVHRESTFRVWRERPDGEHEELIITLLDMGPDAHMRYNVTAECPATARSATGNRGDSVYRVLRGLHWRDLDGPPLAE
jgi:hypothetical protein